MQAVFAWQEEFYPQLTVPQELFEIDRRRITYAVDTAFIELMYGIANKKLVYVIGEIEQQTERPLSTLALAEAINVTRRQLERLFRLHLNDTPSTSIWACTWRKPGNCCGKAV
ncbi:hypothetical protein BKM30_11320 [Pseudomonas syringae pv. syringae]|nr:helix-turn-helix, AraC type:ThiJ/PfpI [Pseudomonas syringae pv. aceris str. M302273]KWS18486.1 hypothetical protein AL062_25895 [Pseudomonas syringae pv. syringae]RXT66176.1 hypothetical protein B1F74_08055 [Pseudomonas syringae]KWS22831.1 hypothetical protein AL061_23475 [Pseudomonas syringae pv. syringae]POR70010.1 hypothetical protein BKM27_11935 [Pseudomonas syringae pv. syringae]